MPDESSSRVPTGAGSAADLAGREVLVGVSGGIAAFKTCALVSALVQRGAGVTVVMTDAATRFVGPLTFESLTARRVILDLWSAEQDRDSRHIHVTERAHLVIIAPATANVIGKMAHGIADDALTTMVLAAPGPLLLAPAMNDRMWRNAIVQRNIEILRAAGWSIVEPESGWLACRTIGEGRMAEPQTILETATRMLIGGGRR
ncbi:MAG: phosphopantothenoylcysteine decarboxylase [Phycisphaerae bacterium]|nr:MAG: phosphopantothenoylcysteine decarboxylase [Planctomycetota bacterium]KAB2938602.1 MAG: phosphopantothenoylcysteine decarboxylase [Phycisphaerae bacterium]MCK6466227.1 phosphopantothenoylcysteine decarboxylase [Phycisphaerae bacterium]MCQ3922317.1 phosphopantothenoylcysteine decarboxylase [Planctomycetota bacterium]